MLAAIIWHPDQANTLLISQRQQGKHLAHYWELPGGKKETGETREQTLQRELLEEVGIRIVDSRPFMQIEHEYHDRIILLDVWQVLNFNGSITGREGQKTRWIKIGELKNYRFPEADEPVIKAITSIAKVKKEHPL